LEPVTETIRVSFLAVIILSKSVKETELIPLAFERVRLEESAVETESSCSDKFLKSIR
jgi:hypothetical protein